MTTVRTIVRALAVCAAGVMVSGCSDTGTIFFVSKTSISLEAGVKPPAASLGYDRFEGYIAPKPRHGEVPSMLAGFVSDGGFFSPHLCQAYALGNAADGGKAEVYKPDNQRTAIVAGSSTTLGLRVGYTTAMIDDIMLGFRRKETAFAYLRTDDEHPPSVLSTFSFGYDPSNPPDVGTMTISSGMATGAAAAKVVADAAAAGKSPKAYLEDWLKDNCPLK